MYDILRAIKKKNTILCALKFLDGVCALVSTPIMSEIYMFIIFYTNNRSIVVH